MKYDINTVFSSNRSEKYYIQFFLTIGLLTLVRVGSFIPLPYIDVKTFSPISESNVSVYGKAEIRAPVHGVVLFVLKLTEVEYDETRAPQLVRTCTS